LCELITEILHAALPCYRPGGLPRKSPLGPCVSQRPDASQATPRPFDSGVGSVFCPASDESPWRPGPGEVGSLCSDQEIPGPPPSESGPRFPIPGRIGNRGFPVSQFPPNRELGNPRFGRESGIGDSRRIGNRGFPPRFPARIPDSRPNRESGKRELGISGSACVISYLSVLLQG
jgi:hypothetical protein